MTTQGDGTDETSSEATGTRPQVSRRRVLAIAGGSALLAACTKASAKSAPTIEPTSTSTAPTTTVAATTTVAPTTTAAPTTTLPPILAPLTGLPTTDPTLPTRVAVVVKVSNDPGARPQTGLNDADIVFEAWGAGPTRFAAIFQSRDSGFVGPIRSCREQDVNLVGGFNRAVFACSGGNAGNIALLRQSDMMLITESQGPGWQLDPDRKRPHKTHADTAQLRSNAGLDRTGPSQQFQYRGIREPAPVGERMAGFDLQIQSVFAQWRFYPEPRAYLRAQNGEPHTLTDGNHVSTENVIVLWLDYNASSTDARSPDGVSTGTGAAVVFTGGRMIEGTWTRADRLDPFALTDSSGAPILLAPGRTFIELPNSGNGRYRGDDTFTAVP